MQQSYAEFERNESQNLGALTWQIKESSIKIRGRNTTTQFVVNQIWKIKQEKNVKSIVLAIKATAGKLAQRENSRLQWREGKKLHIKND